MLVKWRLSSHPDYGHSNRTIRHASQSRLSAEPGAARRHDAGAHHDDRPHRGGSRPRDGRAFARGPAGVWSRSAARAAQSLPELAAAPAGDGARGTDTQIAPAVTAPASL